MAENKEDTRLSAEWSEFFDVMQFDGGKPKTLSISAEEGELRDMARRLGVTAVKALKADLKLVQDKNSMIVHVTGKLEAQVEQDCVISGAPVVSALSEEIEGWFADPQQAISLVKARREKELKAGGSEIPMLEEKDDPEAIVDGKIDLGELVVQHLSLAIDPYPHAEGVEFSGEYRSAGDTSQSFGNPFAKLAEWKNSLKEE